MYRRKFFKTALCALTLGGAAHAHAETLPAAVARALDARNIPAAQVSLVVRAAPGDAVVAHNAAAARNPASVVKLVTTLAALEMLGPDFQWRSEYFADGEISGGVLDGDLIFRGGGDPFITVEDFLGHLLALRQAGVTRINGNFRIDDSRFAAPQKSRGALDGRTKRAYNAEPGAALLNLSATQFVIEPRDGRITVRAEPPLAGLRVTSAIESRSGKCIARARGWRYRITRAPATSPLESTGKIATPEVRAHFQGRYHAQCGVHKFPRTLFANDEYACRIFGALWREMGGSVGGCYRGHTPPHARKLVTRDGAPLADIITGINKFSNNVMARQLLLTLGAETILDAHTANENAPRMPAPATPKHGVTAVQQWLRDSNIAMPALRIDNGAGLSRASRASAAGLSNLLAHAWRSRYRAEFLSSLPLAATDGTMRKRLRGKLAARARIKTGLLNGVRSMAGYVYAADGNYYSVVLLIDSPRVNFSGGNAVQDAVLKWVYAR